MSHPSSASTLLRFALLPLAAAAVLTTGCANMVSTATGAGSASSYTLTGQLHGGNQPIVGSSVQLLSAGATGYGSTGTLFATTTTDASGNFSFTKLATNTGATTPTTPVYGCPATGDPQMYLLAKGGNTQGAGNGANSAAGFILAFGKCSAVSAATIVSLNEVTSVATLAALQQYFNPGTERFGYAATAQSATGFANGVSTIANLVNVSTGVAVATSTPTSAVAGVTVTSTAENAKLNTIADILAACVNTTSNASPVCTTLFANAVPPASAVVTSQPALTFAAATDTLQAGYYMMVNPTASQDPTGKMATLYALAAANSPFQPTLSIQPLDWTLGITYSSTSTCTNANAAPFMSSMESIAVDANGNVFFNNGQSASTGALGELSPNGAPALCAFGNIPSGRGITVDTIGNVWTTGSNTTSSVYEYMPGGATLNWPTANPANGIASDGQGNIFYAPLSVAAPFQEYVGGAAATTTAASIPVAGNATSSANYLYVAADTAGRIWTAASSSAVFYDLYKDAAGTNGFTLVDAGTASLTTTVSNNAYGSAIDSNGNIFAGNTCCAATASNTLFKITPSPTAGVTTGTNSPKYLGGIVAPRSTAVDGAGNVWAGMGYPTVTAALNTAGGVNIFALAEVDNTLTLGLSPNGSTPATCSSTGTNCPTQGGFQKASLGTVRSLAIDPTGNVWAASNNGSTQVIVEIVGTAVPVVTPLAIGVKNQTLGTKP